MKFETYLLIRSICSVVVDLFFIGVGAFILRLIIKMKP